MRALLVSTSLAGGAGGAAARLHGGLLELGVDARVVVARGPVPEDSRIVVHRASRARRIVHRRLERRPMRRYTDPGPGQFSVQWIPTGVHRTIAALEPDVVNLHWVCGGFVSVRTVPRIHRPLVWTLHDMWPFTGGCHYAESCARYRARCGACPQLGSSDEPDLSRRIFARKQRAWRHVEITAVCPSIWLAGCARDSTLFGYRRVEVIPYGIDLATFRPVPKAEARAALGLPDDRPIALFGAWSDVRRKGRAQLIEALRCLASRPAGAGLCVVAFGPRWSVRLPSIEVRALGRIDDPAALAAAYAAADVFVLPSLADNLPTTAIEALACGTPCVGFRVGGVPELIEHERTGWLAEPFDPVSLADGIAWVLGDAPRRAELGARARQKAERDHDARLEARRYHELFAELVQS